MSETESARAAQCAERRQTTPADRQISTAPANGTPRPDSRIVHRKHKAMALARPVPWCEHQHLYGRRCPRGPVARRPRGVGRRSAVGGRAPKARNPAHETRHRRPPPCSVRRRRTALASPNLPRARGSDGYSERQDGRRVIERLIIDRLLGSTTERQICGVASLAPGCGFVERLSRRFRAAPRRACPRPVLRSRSVSPAAAGRARFAQSPR